MIDIIHDKNSPNIKLYREIYKDKATYIINSDDNTTLFKHYGLNSIPSIIGKSYSWGKGYVRFNTNSSVTTTWGNGTYKFVDIDTVRVSWNGCFHILVFDFLYENYLSTNIGNIEITKGSRI
jgi:hypothetical protein